MTSLGPGRYETSGTLGQLLEAIDLEGFSDDFVGGDDGGESATLIEGEFDLAKLHENWPAEVDALDDTERTALAAAAGAVLYRDSQGFVDVKLFETHDGLVAHWEELQKLYRYGDEDVCDFEANASRRPPPPPRRGRLDTKRRLGRVVREEEEKEKPFDPERPYTRETKGHHFAVNARASDFAVGDKVFIDSFAGLVPAAVTATPVRDRDGGEDQVQVRITATRGAYKKGEISTHSARSIVKREWVHVRSGKYVIREPAHKPNHHHSLRGGLHTDRHLLDQLVEMAAESMELENYKDAHATDEVVAEAERYDTALAAALDEVVQRFPPKGGATADDLWDAEAPYLVLMTLRGEGVGIWDGRWDEFYPGSMLKRGGGVRDLLGQQLDEFAADTGSGSLENAFMNAASETTGDPEYETNARGPRGEADQTAATELELYIDNDPRFSTQSSTGQGSEIVKNLLRKRASGKYDHAKAPKLWMYLVESAAKAYAKEYSSSERDWNMMFNVPTRMLVAQSLADEFRTQADGGEYSHVDTKIRRNGSSAPTSYLVVDRDTGKVVHSSGTLGLAESKAAGLNQRSGSRRYTVEPHRGRESPATFSDPYRDQPVLKDPYS